MPQELLFHEKCTADVNAILILFNQEAFEDPTKKRKEFLSRLTETYQNIHENFQVGFERVVEIETVWNEQIPKFIAPVSEFPYLVVYAMLRGKTKKLVVLGVIGTESYYELVAGDRDNRG
jgi:hypothetical protein